MMPNIAQLVCEAKPYPHLSYQLNRPCCVSSLLTMPVLDSLVGEWLWCFTVFQACWLCLSGIFRMWVAACLFVFYSCWWDLPLALHWSYLSLPTCMYVHSFLLSLLTLSIFHHPACIYSLYAAQAIIWLLDKTRHTMSLLTIQNVLALNYHYLSLWLMCYISLVPLLLILAINFWCLVLHFYCFLSVFNSVAAVIIIFKHATYLKLSSSSAESTLTHAEMDFWSSKIDLKIL